MGTMQEQFDRLVDRAADCALIAASAADKVQRDRFARLAMHYSVQATSVERAIAEAAAGQSPRQKAPAIA